jgi:hypothetical protein
MKIKTFQSRDCLIICAYPDNKTDCFHFYEEKFPVNNPFIVKDRPRRIRHPIAPFLINLHQV